MILAIGFRLVHRDYLGTELHHLCLGHHTSSSQKVLKAYVDQRQVIADRGAFPTLANAAYLTAPDVVSFPETVAMVCSSQVFLQVVPDTLLRRDHHATQEMDSVVLAQIKRETYLGEYSPCSPSLNPNLPALITRWIQICLSDWITWQW